MSSAETAGAPGLTNRGRAPTFGVRPWQVLGGRLDYGGLTPPFPPLRPPEMSMKAREGVIRAAG